MNRFNLLQKTKRLVIKVGSGLLTNETGPNLDYLKELTNLIDNFRQGGFECVLVSSGAVACGMATLRLAKKPTDIAKKQAVASVGQPILIKHYSDLFTSQGTLVGQVLLTRADLENRHRFLNARHALAELLKDKILPIVNENDSVAVEEIQFGDNDQLSAMVAHLVDADLLLILTDIDGLYDVNPKKSKNAKRLSVVEKIEQSHLDSAEGTSTIQGTGGMITKLKAAQQAALYGIATWILDGKTISLADKVRSGADIGTLFLAQEEALSSRKYWIGVASKTKGSLIVDEGAIDALINKKKSLLPSGIRQIEGHFEIGDPLEVKSESGKIIAKGLVNYSSIELNKIKGIKSSEIEQVLGYKYVDEIIHRDDLVVL